MKKFLIVPFVIALMLATYEAQAQTSSSNPLRIDIPTKLQKSDIVIDYGHAAYIGDALFGINDIGLLVSELQKSKASGTVIVVFHGDAAYLTLNDHSYNANRHVSTGNPFASQLQKLMSSGVQLELCGATAVGNHWTNDDLLQGVKVNVNAMVRITQLEQSGYTLIYQ